jgi:hypothetical protein
METQSLFENAFSEVSNSKLSLFLFCPNLVEGVYLCSFSLISLLQLYISNSWLFFVPFVHSRGHTKGLAHGRQAELHPQLYLFFFKCFFWDRTSLYSSDCLQTHNSPGLHACTTIPGFHLLFQIFSQQPRHDFLILLVFCVFYCFTFLHLPILLTSFPVEV